MAHELILIIEDHDKNRKLLRDVLQVTGYRTVEAETAEEGLRLARKARPALVLMDLQLPGMDGFAALAALRANATTQAIPVIAVTASAMSHQRPQILAAGFDGYQTKPIQVREFLQVIRDVLDRRQVSERPTDPQA
jgi:two-component system cell cycle response regulator DivK